MLEASTARADSQTVYNNSSEYCQKPRILFLVHYSTVPSKLLSAAMASRLREAFGDHYLLPNNEVQENGEEIGKTGWIVGMIETS